MYMRKITFAPGEYYHILNRGNNKQVIFLTDEDRARFLFLILFLQSPKVLTNISIYANHFIKHSVFNISKKIINEIIEHRYVELINFTLMPNHFHLTVYEKKEEGISRYMQRILNAYTKYFNTKYEMVGHLFQGPFKAVHIEDNEQLLYLSSYIHLNPREINEWKNKEDRYPWSSYQDYIKQNRWSDLLRLEIITNQFNNQQEYKHFVKTSSAKQSEEESDLEY